jgi:methionyl-tRNA formyltransferase
VWEASALKENSHAKPGTLIALSDKGLEIACGEGTLLLSSIQIPSKKAMSVKDLLKGYKDRFALNELFGQ